MSQFLSDCGCAWSVNIIQNVNFDFTQMAVQIQFTNKGLFYIALSVDLSYGNSSLIIKTFTPMAGQIPFISDCLFYTNLLLVTVCFM